MTGAVRGAMVLAAGLGLRMRPLTETVPKPLLGVGGRTMLDRVLDHLEEVGIARPVVNTHWLGESIHRHLAGRAGVVFSDESELLDTGGGVAKALPLLGANPFFVCNADIIWEDGTSPALARLAAAWDDAAMDCLLLVHPTGRAFGYDGCGDFFLDADHRLRRRADAKTAPFLFTGVQMLHPRLFDSAPAGRFSLNLLYDRAATSGRLFGLVHDGDWYHVGTPAALAAAETLLGGGAPVPRPA
jgi:MurNAc alpha-1-phosphate uridylyltransferase